MGFAGAFNGVVAADTGAGFEGLSRPGAGARAQPDAGAAPHSRPAWKISLKIEMRHLERDDIGLNPPALSLPGQAGE